MTTERIMPPWSVAVIKYMYKHYNKKKYQALSSSSQYIGSGTTRAQGAYAPLKLLARRVRMGYYVHSYVVPMQMRRYYELLSCKIFLQNIHFVVDTSTKMPLNYYTLNTPTTGEPHSYTQHHTTLRFAFFTSLALHSSHVFLT